MEASEVIKMLAPGNKSRPSARMIWNHVTGNLAMGYLKTDSEYVHRLCVLVVHQNTSGTCLVIITLVLQLFCVFGFFAELETQVNWKHM